MLSSEDNDRLTRVAPNTPMGRLLRMYWYPIAASAELAQTPVKPVKLLGESLVLYKDRQGQLGLVGDTCPHRRVNLAYGIPEHNGLRCPYHGWLYDGTGQCIEMPAEPADSMFKRKIKIAGYSVRELGGMVFAYLGPQPTPLLPRWELYSRDDVPKEIGFCVIPCNWLQIMENSVDPVHVEWLHRHFYNYVMERLGREEKCIPVPHEKIGFDVFEYGIIKRRVLEGDTEQDENWQVGHPVLFPNILVSGSARTTIHQIRVPMDDMQTLHVWYTCYFGRNVAEKVRPEGIPFYQVPVPQLDAAGLPQWNLVDNNGGQDIAMWITQGEIADRSVEHLGESDQGVILYRKLLSQELEKVERGEDPMCVFRDPGDNAPIRLRLEENKARRSMRAPRAGNASRYSPLLNELQSKGVDVGDILVGSRED